MASNISGPEMAKLTFAKVAASGYKPSTFDKTNPSPTSRATPAVAAVPVQSRTPTKGDITHAPERRNGANEDDAEYSRRPRTTVDTLSTPNVALSEAQSRIANNGAEDANTASEAKATDDGSTQISSSNNSPKPAAMDNKSVVSVGTLGMDEKESLRPEDSASLKAPEEEDRISVQGAGDNGSRGGSDSGARAFRDQLQEISHVAAPRPTGAPTNAFEPAMMLNAESPFDGNVIGGVPSTADLQSFPQPVPIVVPVRSPPDERLIEAVTSGRDRVWVLKLEQDIIDFLKDSTETELTLPQCNSFYRMLAHKLADYYLLDHSTNNTIQGVLVVIRRTPFCNTLPPPLFAMPIASSVSSTPPPNVHARKIMRRDGNATSFPSTTANSDGPSKSTSEAGGEANGETGGQSNGAQGKSSLTREEREAKYNEVRLRIFGTLENTDANDGENKIEEKKGDSRASSSSGKKKGRKQRDDSDDFEPRSMFQPPQYSAPPPFDASTRMYHLYGSSRNGNFSALQRAEPATSSCAYQPPLQTEQQVQYQYPGSPYGMYISPANNEYDLSASFQQGMQSFQNAAPSPYMDAPQSPMPQHGYPHSPYQYQGVPQYQPQWPQGPYQAAYAPQCPQMPYMPVQFHDRSGPSPGQGPPTYPFPQATTATAYPRGQQQNIQGPAQQTFMGGKYSLRAKFDPQSQAFVPGHRFPPSSPPPRMLCTMQMPTAQAMPRMTSPHLQPRAINQHIQMPPQPQMPMAAPNGRHGVSSYNSPRLPAHPSPFYPNSYQTGNSANGSYSGMNNSMAPTQQPLSHPLPTPPNPSSSIAKWGTPAHLPAKPPPPATLEPLKYNELTRGFQGLPGMPFVGPNGLNVAYGSAGVQTITNAIPNATGDAVDVSTNGNTNGSGDARGDAQRG